MLAQHLVRVELLRACQCFGLRYRHAEAVPRDNRGDRVKRILFAVARRNQGGANPGIEANLLVDGATIGLERPGMLPFGPAEHRPDQPVEQVDCLVCQAGSEIERDGDQGGMSALAFVSSHVLHCGAAGFTGELGETRLMNAVAASRLDADCPDVNQTLDQTQHCQRLRRFRHLA